HFAFRVSGDSMDDGSSNSIPKNSVVFSRAIEQSMWNKIYLSQYRFFVVVTPSGVMVRKLKEVDDENKTIEFASINPDKNKYADLVLKFSEINMLLNVISSTVFF